ncbi:hypothetical protein [Ralstonia pseudosolanacearum]|uniref:hypothetical protein n=2 Tax=Ralstonia pseudosolanacearum TaxID=1310165 RepID=UPI001FFC38C1|nr:hypothetical protein [Ralstonia pseudosolanacearum]
MTAKSVGPQAHHDHPSLARIRERAAQLGFTCLESEWRGYHVTYAFSCSAGHTFSRQASSVVYAKPPAPCPLCEREALRQRFLAMATERGGICLEGDYLGPEVRHRMRCQHSHEWQALGRKLLGGSWCHTCARETINAKTRARGKRLEDLQAKAAERGGRCLASEYRGTRAHHELICAQGHRWTSTGDEILRGTWCRLCAHREVSERKTDPEGLSRIQAAAQARGGACLDEVYLGQSARYRFQCKEGHVWKTAGQNVLNGGWCRSCHHESRRLGIEAMQAVAHARGGRCLSETYINKARRLTWECHHGHVWQTSPRSVFAGHWCPSCAILDRIRAKNQHKRERYEATRKLDTVSSPKRIKV